MLKHNPLLSKAFALMVGLTFAVALSAAPAWAGTISSSTQVNFNQGSGLGMGNFNFGGSLFGSGGSFTPSSFTLDDGQFSSSVTPSPVSAPEPMTWVLLVAGLAGLGLADLLRRRRLARS